MTKTKRKTINNGIKEEKVNPFKNQAIIIFNNNSIHPSQNRINPPFRYLLFSFKNPKQLKQRPTNIKVSINIENSSDFENENSRKRIIKLYPADKPKHIIRIA